MSKSREIVIAYLYPEEMNIYGDRGNVTVLSKRLAWLGFLPKVETVSPGGKFDFRRVDIVFGGGGQDRGQSMVAEDLSERKANLRKAAQEGVVMLAICGTYQLFGHGFTTAQGDELPGVGIFNAYTNASNKRMIGNVVVKTPFGELVGFENHSGQTELKEGQKALGKVVKGYGNNSFSREEGAVTQNAFGSYMHGPLLPKNPGLADELIKRALKRRNLNSDFSKLNNHLELEASQVAKKRPQ